MLAGKGAVPFIDGVATGKFPLLAYIIAEPSIVVRVSLIKFSGQHTDMNIKQGQRVYRRWQKSNTCVIYVVIIYIYCDKEQSRNLTFNFKKINRKHTVQQVWSLCF